MLERLKDKVAEIRAQAVTALQRLQVSSSLPIITRAICICSLALHLSGPKGRPMPYRASIHFSFGFGP